MVIFIIHINYKHNIDTLNDFCDCLVIQIPKLSILLINYFIKTKKTKEIFGLIAKVLIS